MRNYKNFKILNESIESIFKRIRTINEINGLMDLGVDINIKDENGKTLLFYFTDDYYSEEFEYIIKNYNPDINVKYKKGTLFTYCGEENKLFLLERPELKLNDYDLMRTIMFDNFEIIYKVLNKFDVNLDLKPKKAPLINLIITDLEEEFYQSKYNKLIRGLLKTKYKKYYDNYIKQQHIKNFNI